MGGRRGKVWPFLAGRSCFCVGTRRNDCRLQVPNGTFDGAFFGLLLGHCFNCVASTEEGVLRCLNCIVRGRLLRCPALPVLGSSISSPPPPRRDHQGRESEHAWRGLSRALETAIDNALCRQKKTFASITNMDAGSSP